MYLPIKFPRPFLVMTPLYTVGLHTVIPHPLYYTAAPFVQHPSALHTPKSGIKDGTAVGMPLAVTQFFVTSSGI